MYEQTGRTLTLSGNAGLKLSLIPTIELNDILAGLQVSFSDNDKLSALVSSELDADLLILLSDIDGLYTADPRCDENAKLISVVEEITPEIIALAGGKGSSLGTGGMATKLLAAQIATSAGCDMIIANGSNPELLYKLIVIIINVPGKFSV